MDGQAPDRRQRHVSPTDEEDLVTRIDTARDAAARAKEAAAQYAGEARTRIAPHLETAVDQARHAARSTVDEHLAPRWEQARAHVPPTVGEAVNRTREAAAEAATTAREAASTAREVASTARDTAGPYAHEAQLRSAAALAALRGKVSAEDIERLARRIARRERRSRLLRRAAMAVLAGSGAALGFIWWRRQSSPEWLVESGPSDGAPSATRAAAERANPAGASGATAMPLDPEVQAKSEDSREGNGDQP
jgi:hypothetical protein